MGKALVIKDANFSANAIEQVTPISVTKLVDFDGACDGSTVTINVDLLSTSAPDWAAFAQFAWQGGRTGQIRLIHIASTTNVVQVGYNGTNQYYKAAELTNYSSSLIHTFDNSIRKIGFKKQNSKVYATFDGVTWTQTEFVPDANMGTVYIWGNPVQCPNLTELKLIVWNDPDYNISPLFSA